MKLKPSRLLLAGALAVLLGACAQSNGDINRVQPNVMKKADLLDGVWYYRLTVTDAPPTTGFTFIGETGTMEKIVWEVTETALIGYRSYPFIPGQDRSIESSSTVSGTTAKRCELDANGKEVCTGGQKYYGSPIVAYPIRSHFDIQRGYNAATGETNNTISENASDRPWNEREFIRVDWSASVMNPNAGLSYGSIGNAAGASVLSAWIQPNEPGTRPEDWPHQEFVGEGDAAKLNYFDFSGRYFAVPDRVYFDGYGYVPLCYFGSGYARYDCNATEIKVRTSIAKIDPNKTKDYQPLVYDNAMMSKFGYFRTERLNYDRKFGFTESARIRLANRYNIWQETYTKTADGTPDETKPIPFAQRKEKPIVYHMPTEYAFGSKEEYDQYLAAGRILEKNWDKAFRRAVAAAKGVARWEDIPNMFVLCENPVKAGANAACGPEGSSARFGDLRKSFLYTITDPTPNGLLGYGPSSPDPETGEIISANANTYSGAVDSSAQYALDVVDILSGEKTIDTHIRGADVIKYINETHNYANAKKYHQGVQPLSSGKDKGAFERLTPQLNATFDRLKAGQGLTAPSVDRAKIVADLLRQNPGLESRLIDNPDAQNDLLGLAPDAVAQKALNDSNVKAAIARRMLVSPTDELFANRARIDALSRKNLYMAEFFDHAFYGYAQELKKQRDARMAGLTPGTPEYETRKKDVRKELLKQIQNDVWRSTSEHEVGHTLGLRHNFQGSFDAINFFDTWWDIKKDTLTVDFTNDAGVTVKAVPRTVPDLLKLSNMTENVVDPVSGAVTYVGQRERKMHDYGYSSIMDYAGKVNADFQGVGKYDEAAIIFAYSGGSTPGYVEVFDSARLDAKDFQGSNGKTLTITGAQHDLPVINAAHKNQGIPNYLERFHYSLAPLHFGDDASGDLPTIMEDGIKKMRVRKLMKWSDVKAQNDKLNELLAVNPNPSASDVTNLLGATPVLEVPYMFCTDDHVGYVLSCNRFDRGPDYYEMSRQWLEDYKNDYFFTHFKRGRLNFSSGSAYSNSLNSFYEQSMVYKHFVFALAGNQRVSEQSLPNYGPSGLAPQLGYDPTFQDLWAMGAVDGIYNLLNTFSVPPAGVYYYIDEDVSDGQGGTWNVLDQGDDFDYLTPEGEKRIRDVIVAQLEQEKLRTGKDFLFKIATLPRGEGRRMYSRYDFKSGFLYYDRLLEAGHYNDQIGALIASIIPNHDTINSDDQTDPRRYWIPYFTVFSDELMSTYGALWGIQEQRIRPTVGLEKNADGSVSDRLKVYYTLNPIRGDKLIAGLNYPPQPVLTADQIPAPVNIEMTYTSRIYALIYGMAYFNVNFDLDFAKRNQVFKLGGHEEIEVAPGYTRFEVQDPVTGARYVAVEPTAIAGTGPHTAAVEMIRRAQQAEICAKNPFAVNTQGNLICMSDRDTINPNEVERVRREAILTFKDRVSDLDLMRGVYMVFGKAL